VEARQETGTEALRWLCYGHNPQTLSAFMAFWRAWVPPDIEREPEHDLDDI
jgi:hypothetical protein